MSEELKESKWRLWLYTKRFVTISAAAGTIFLIYSSVTLKIEHLIDEKVEFYFEPQNKFADAMACFDSDRDEEGFRTLRSAIELYQKRNLPRERSGLENALHNYLFYVTRSKSPHLNELKFEYIISSFKTSGVSYTFFDKTNIGWYKFWRIQPDLAWQDFYSVVCEASQAGDLESANKAYDGLLWCSLASGNLSEAVKSWEFGASTCYTTFIYNEYDPSIRRAISAYPRFKTTVIEFINELGGRKAAERTKDTEGK